MAGSVLRESAWSDLVPSAGVVFGVAAWLLEASAGVGIALYVGGLATGAVDMATTGVAVGVCGVVGNLALGVVRLWLGDAEPSG
jgi:hypothetical protein